MKPRNLFVVVGIGLVALSAAACHKKPVPQYTVSFDVEELPPAPPEPEPTGPVLASVRAGAAGPFEPKGEIDVQASGRPGLAVSARIGASGRPGSLAEAPGSPGSYSGRVPLQGLAPGTYDLVAEASGDAGQARVTSPVKIRVVASLMQEKIDALNARLQPVYFETSRWGISPDALEKIRANAEVLRSSSGFLATVEGHGDERGTEEHNRWLGLWRAKEVKDTLRNLGLDPAGFTLVTHGSTHPASAGTDPESLARNRRVEIVIQRLP